MGPQGDTAPRNTTSIFGSTNARMNIYSQRDHPEMRKTVKGKGNNMGSECVLFEPVKLEEGKLRWKGEGCGVEKKSYCSDTITPCWRKKCPKL